MGPTWVLSAPSGLHVVPMNLAIRDVTSEPRIIFELQAAPVMLQHWVLPNMKYHLIILQGHLTPWTQHLHGLEQNRRNSSVSAMELHLSCNKATIFYVIWSQELILGWGWGWVVVGGWGCQQVKWNTRCCLTHWWLRDVPLILIVLFWNTFRWFFFWWY